MAQLALSHIKIILLIISALLLQSCATSAQKSAPMRLFMEQGLYDKALAAAQKASGHASDLVMEKMNLGLLYYLNNDYQTSNQLLQQAKDEIERLYATSISEQLGAGIVNDEVISFQGAAFEQLLIHLYMANNYIALNDLDAARVEILQANLKMQQWDSDRQLPFIHYYSGILFEMLGEKDSALISYRKAYESYTSPAHASMQDLPRQLQRDLLRLLNELNLEDEFQQYKEEFSMQQYQPVNHENMGELLVLLANGMAPLRNQKFILSWSHELSLNIKIAIPDYSSPPDQLFPLRIAIEDKIIQLETVANIDAMARAALARDMPLITSRAIARAIIKKSTEKKVSERNGGFAQLAMMIINQATEIADTRSWNSLPQEFQLARFYLKPGQYTLKLEVLGSNDTIIDSIPIAVEIKQGKIKIVNYRWAAAKTSSQRPAPNRNRLFIQHQVELR